MWRRGLFFISILFLHPAPILGRAKGGVKGAGKQARLNFLGMISG